MATVITTPPFKETDRVETRLSIRTVRGKAELKGALGWGFDIDQAVLAGPLGKIEGFVGGVLGAPAELDLTTLPTYPDAKLGSGVQNLGILHALIIQSRQDNPGVFCRVKSGGAVPWTSGPFGPDPGAAILPGGRLIYIGGAGPLGGWIFSDAQKTFQIESEDANAHVFDIYYSTRPFVLP